MTMLGSILTAGAARPGGLLAPMGEGGDSAATGLGEMFAAVIAAASAPAGEPGAESGAAVAAPTAAVSPSGDPDAALVTELTQVVLGNGGVARGEAQSLPTPEPLPEKRVLAQASAGEPRTPRPVVTPQGFDQPVLTKAVGSGSAGPVIAAAVDPAVLQPGDDSAAATPAAAKPTRRGLKAADADSAASPVVDPAQPATAAIVLAAPSPATPAQTHAAASPAPADAVQRKSIDAYRAGIPAKAKDTASAPRPVRFGSPDAAPTRPAAMQAGAAPVTVAPPAELIARAVAEALAPAGRGAGAPAAARHHPVSTSASDALARIAAPAGEAAVATPPATGTATPLAFATPSPLHASRQAESAAGTVPQQPQVATAVTSSVIAPEADADLSRSERAETAAPGAAPGAAAANPATGPAPVATTAVQAPAIDGAPRIEASAPAAPQLGAVLSDQVIDMGIEGQWIDRLAREITQVADGTGHARFQLAPPNLGRIQVDLWQGEAGGRVHLLTETDEAAMRLREGQSTLQADARLAALSLGQVVIERAAGGNLDGQGQRDQNAQSNPQPQSQPRGQDSGQTAQQNGQQQGQPQPWGQNATGSGPSQGQSGNSGGQHGKSGDPRAVLDERGQDAGTTTGGESRVRYA